MSEHNARQQRDYSKFDTMPTDTLEEILRLDAQLPEGETPDPDAILHIMEVLARREKESENSSIPDVEAAWRTFNESYRPCSEDAVSLYEEEEPADTSSSSKKPADIQATPLPAKNRSDRRVRRLSFRLGFAAMLAVVVLVAGTATASAFGYDVWKALANWTGEVFGFKEELAATQQLQAMRFAMKEHGIDAEAVLPTYLPEGYEVVNTQCQVEEDYIRFDCLLSDTEDSIILMYRVYLDDNYTFEFEKNYENPELYEVDGIAHYIMENVDTYLVVWANDNVECNILGVPSVEEAKKIIDSIYEG